MASRFGCGHERCVLQGGAARLPGRRITANLLSRNEEPGQWLPGSATTIAARLRADRTSVTRAAP